MTRMDGDELLDALNSRADMAAGAMYARALVMGLIELREDGLRHVRTAHDELLGDPAANDHA